MGFCWLFAKVRPKTTKVNSCCSSSFVHPIRHCNEALRARLGGVHHLTTSLSSCHMPSVNAMQHKSSWRHLDTCRQPLPTQNAGLDNPLDLSQLSVGQVQVNFLFFFSFAFGLPHTAASSGFYDGFVHKLPVGLSWSFVPLSLSLFLPPSLSLCDELLSTCAGWFSVVCITVCLLSLAFHTARIFTRFSSLRWTTESRKKAKQSKVEQRKAMPMAFQHYFLICPALYFGPE